MRLLNHPKNVVGKVVYSATGQWRRVTSVSTDGFVSTVDIDGFSNGAMYYRYWVDSELTRKLTREDTGQ